MKYYFFCGIEKQITFHVARHTFATLFLEKTDDLATLKELLGHSNIVQTMVYAHISEEKKKEQNYANHRTPNYL